MSVQRLAAFTLDGAGGNPAGVVLGQDMQAAEQMQAIAAEVGYSETAFAERQGKSFRTRYFAPEAEVPFCGHATIALGAALGRAYGVGRFELVLNDAEISVEAYREGEAWGARLISPPTRHELLDAETLEEARAIFGLAASDMDPEIAAARAHGGADHLLLPLSSAEALQAMAYDFEQGAAFMQRQKLVTINLIWRESSDLIHSRNAFAGHGVYEDPATGAAAAALAGYLRDSGLQSGAFRVLQGVDMGRPSELWVEPLPGKGAPVSIAGLTAEIPA